jgi:hypothetical protein
MMGKIKAILSITTTTIKNNSKFSEWNLKPSIPIIHKNCPVSVSHLNICFNTEEATFTQLSFILSETQHTLLNYLGPGSKF